MTRAWDRGRVDTDHAGRLVPEDLVSVPDPGAYGDRVARPSIERFVFDGPAHASGADGDHVVLRRIVHVRLLDLPDGVGDRVDLDVVEPDALVLVVRSHEAAVVGLVGDLDHRLPPIHIVSVRRLSAAAEPLSRWWLPQAFRLA
jgi:hypothetical protein